MFLGHGGEIYRLAKKLGVPPDEISDHSSNVSPLPPPTGFYEHLKKHLHEIENLPEIDSESLRDALARYFSLDESTIFPTSGTTEWIYSLPRILKPRWVIVLSPTYSDYADAATAARLGIEYITAREEENFTPPIKRLYEKIKENMLIFICNPNNPTGQLIPKEKLKELIIKKSSSYFIVDESYIDFVKGENHSLLDGSPLPANLIVLRSFSKIYRIPGLRLGFAATSTNLKEELWANMLPWSLNRLAQIAGPWLLKQKKYLEEVKKFIVEEKKWILPRLKNLPVTIFPSEVHYFLLKLKKHTSAEVWKKLLHEHKILIRNANNFYGLEGEFIRFALRTRKENEKLITALENILT